MDCSDPPITETPTGTWACPECERSRLPNGLMIMDPPPPPNPMYHPMQIVEESGSTPSIGRGTSVASTSQSAFGQPQDHPADLVVTSKSRKGRPPAPGKPRGRPPRPKHPPPDVASDAMQVEGEPGSATPKVPRSTTTTTTTTRTRTIKRSRLAREAAEARGELSEGDDGEAQSSPLRVRRRKQPQPYQPKEPSPGHSLPRVRLRLPTQIKGKGKGKERAEEEDESSTHGLFDDILNEGDRDTSKTQITRIDKHLFERSRQFAEVRRERIGIGGDMQC